MLKPCAYCKTPFNSIRSWHTFCSKQCREAHWHEQNTKPVTTAILTASNPENLTRPTSGMFWEYRNRPLIYGWFRASRYLLISFTNNLAQSLTTHAILSRREPLYTTDELHYWLDATPELENHLHVHHKPLLQSERSVWLELPPPPEPTVKLPCTPICAGCDKPYNPFDAGRYYTFCSTRCRNFHIYNENSLPSAPSTPPEPSPELLRLIALREAREAATSTPKP